MRALTMLFIARVALILVLTSGLRSLAGADPLPTVRIDDIPHVQQKPDFCGEACAAMFLGKLGSEADQDYVFDRSGLDPLLGRGCYTKELGKALRAIGFDVGKVFYSCRPEKAKEELGALFKDLHADLERGVPSIVCMRYDGRPKTTEHFRLVVGYDADSDEVIYHEPAVADGAYRKMSRQDFFDLWPLKYRKDRWTVIRFPLSAKKIEKAVPAKTFTAADYAQHVRELKKKLPGSSFTVLIEPPFVVIGDETPSGVKRRAKSTIRWSVDLLKKEYFSKDPEKILDIWLFKDKESYGKHTRSVFGTRPTTPFGFYSKYNGALIMNISTGGGTLVHEIVHPFIESNFPGCPAWFNEGLGSLYEQCAERGGHIRGRTNWRLRGLQEAIREGLVPSFKTLTGNGTSDFYNRDPGTNYSQARYLCYYLQEKGRLARFYKKFLANRDDDPTGYRTLKEVLGEDDMDAFKEKWEAFVLKLRF